MSSWRESDDPRCPACGEKITATASYCMHCEVDFAPDGSVIEDTPSDSGESTGQASQSTDDGGGWAGTQPAEPDSSASTAESDPTARPSADTSSSDDYDPDTGRTGSGQTGTIEKTTLLLRGPVAILMGLPAGIMLLFTVLFITGSLSGVASMFLLLAGWVGTTGYLLRKPLASDAIGDAFYIYAGLLLVSPLLSFLGGLVVDLGGGVSSGSLAGRLFAVVFIELFLAVPAGILLLIGYACNYYARNRIEAMLNEQQAGV